MDFITLLILAILIYLALHFGARIIGSWMGSRILAKVMAQPADAPRARLDPESRFVIQMTESDVSCHRPDGIVETVRWNDLERINILTNSDGPFAPRLLLVVHWSRKHRLLHSSRRYGRWRAAGSNVRTPWLRPPSVHGSHGQPS